jgi:hypothetical protein
LSRGTEENDKNLIQDYGKCKSPRHGSSSGWPADLVNKQSRRAEEVWSSILGVGRRDNNSSPQGKKYIVLQARCDRGLEGFCEHGNESSTSIKSREFLDQLSDY